MGIGMKLLWDLGKPVDDALDPDTAFAFISGTLAGPASPSGVRMCAIFQDPALYPKQWVTRSSMAGDFSVELKFAGYDGIVFTGASETPVYVWIEDGHAELKDASNLWGWDTYATDTMIRTELGGDKRIRIATIGPAGENTRRGTIQCDCHHACGIPAGSVLGSKKVKAIAVRGTGEIAVADPVDMLVLRDIQVGYSGDNDGRPDSRIGNIQKYWKHSRGCFGCLNACHSRYDYPDQPKGGNFCGFTVSYNNAMAIPYGEQSLKKNDFGDYNCGRFTPTSPQLEKIPEDYGKYMDLYGIPGHDLISGRLAAHGCKSCVMHLKWAARKALSPNGKKRGWGCFRQHYLAKNIARMASYREGLIGDLLADGTPLAARKLRIIPPSMALRRNRAILHGSTMEDATLTTASNTAGTRQ
jgi:hypothetical protein